MHRRGRLRKECPRTRSLRSESFLNTLVLQELERHTSIVWAERAIRTSGVRAEPSGKRVLKIREVPNARKLDRDLHRRSPHLRIGNEERSSRRASSRLPRSPAGGQQRCLANVDVERSGVGTIVVADENAWVEFRRNRVPQLLPRRSAASSRDGDSHAFVEQPFEFTDHGLRRRIEAAGGRNEGPVIIQNQPSERRATETRLQSFEVSRSALGFRPQEGPLLPWPHACGARPGGSTFVTSSKNRGFVHIPRERAYARLCRINRGRLAERLDDGKSTQHADRVFQSAAVLHVEAEPPHVCGHRFLDGLPDADTLRAQRGRRSSSRPAYAAAIRDGRAQSCDGQCAGCRIVRFPKPTSRSEDRVTTTADPQVGGSYQSFSRTRSIPSLPSGCRLRRRHPQHPGSLGPKPPSDCRWRRHPMPQEGR